MVWSLVYVALSRLLQLVVLLGRSERSKDLEILCSDTSWRFCVGSSGERVDELNLRRRQSF